MIAEMRYEVVPYQVDLLCEVCSTGRMRPEKYTLATSPPQYPHKCNNRQCGAYIEAGLMKKYPYIEYEKKEVWTLHSCPTYGKES